MRFEWATNPDAIAELKIMWLDERLHADKCAAHFGVSEKSIWAIVRRYKWSRPPVRPQGLTQAEKDKLFVLWFIEKRSQQECADQMGGSRSRIAGFINRFGWKRGRIKKVKKDRPKAAKRRWLPGRRLKPEHIFFDTDAEIPVEQRKTLLELTMATCRWPVGDPLKPDFFFCGGQVELDKPYCTAHCNRAFQRFECAEAA